MQKSYPIDRYEFSNYDKHLALKPGFLLLVSACFLCRDFLLPLMVAATSIKGGSSNLAYLLGDPGRPGRFLTGIPALLAMVAFVRRSPEAGMLVRQLWRLGRWLLVLACVLQIGSSMSSLSFKGGNLHYDSGATLAFLAADVAILSYLLLSRRVRDTFADFPQPAPPKAARSRPPQIP